MKPPLEPAAVPPSKQSLSALPGGNFYGRDDFGGKICTSASVDGEFGPVGRAKYAASRRVHGVMAY